MAREICLQDIPPLVQALFNGLYKLDEASQAIVLKEVGKACSRVTRAMRIKMGVEHPTGLDLDSVCGHIMRASGRIDGLSPDEVRHQAVVAKPVPIVPKTLIRGVSERIDSFGNIRH